MTSNALSQAINIEESSTEVAALFERYSSQTCAYLYSMVGNWEVANDLNQDLYLQLFRTRQQLRDVKNPRAWIYQIATNLALNEIKRRKRFAWLPWNWNDAEPKLVWVDSAEEEIAQSEAVAQALAKLSIDYRLPLLLFSGHNFTIQEIAQTLQVSEGAVKTRLHRAREMFARAYEQSDKMAGG